MDNKDRYERRYVRIAIILARSVAELSICYYNNTGRVVKWKRFNLLNNEIKFWFVDISDDDDDE